MATKLQVFDTFWDAIDKWYGGFPYLTVNWDSIKSFYRSEVAAGVSTGRFAAIMGQLQLSLSEIHTWFVDVTIDSTYWADEISWTYKPGVPIFIPSGWGWAGNFGAALTPLPDSSLLVYRAVSPHPLGIVPGDVVLGYDGIPWKQLYQELISVPLPLQWWWEGRWGSSPRSMTHALLNSAGSNWGLFDTIDIVKYATGDTLHLPTAPLSGQDWHLLFATEQVAVPGVQMPDYRRGEQVSWGVVGNTSVGYVYVYSWDSGVGPVFEAAMKDLITVKNVTGLILDFRYNRGSMDSWTAPNAGLDYLFQENPAGMTQWQTAIRSDPVNHFGFSYTAPPGSFSPRPDYYDRPIAVLTGPQAWSVGDHTAFRMRFHPKARSFGLPTNGAFVYGSLSAGPLWGTWWYGFATGQMRSLVNNEGFLTHKSIPVDEEVWLTRDGVAKGEDGVVKRALAWINATNGVAEGEPQVPSQFVLHQNYPNPFNPSTTIRYGLPGRSHVTLAVFNTLGQQITVLQNGEIEAGYHEVKFDGSELSSGVYFYRIHADGFVQMRKLVLLR